MNAPRCVDCRGPHSRGDSTCAVYALAREKNMVLLSSHVLQHVRLTTPAAFIVFHQSPSTPTASAPGSYAAAVCRIVIPADPTLGATTGATTGACGRAGVALFSTDSCFAQISCSSCDSGANYGSRVDSRVCATQCIENGKRGKKLRNLMSFVGMPRRSLG